MSTLSQTHLHNEAAAYEFAEAIIWPAGPVCPRCKETKRVGKLNGKSTRIGVYKIRRAYRRWRASNKWRRKRNREPKNPRL